MSFFLIKKKYVNVYKEKTLTLMLASNQRVLHVFIHHLDLSFSFGGWQPLLDMRNRTLQEAAKQKSVRGPSVSLRAPDSECVCSPQGVDIKHRWLQLGQLYGCDAHGPNVTELVVAAFDFHCCNLWCHPEDGRGQSSSLDFEPSRENILSEVLKTKSNSGPSV